MMQVFRASRDRGHAKSDWLDSYHTFSFGHYHDPAWMGWGPLRVINEDRVVAAAGFAPHRHANMEIISYVLDGALSHRDNGGGQGVIAAGEMQWMSAGSGIEHSEYNDSADKPVHFLQIWIQPDRLNAAPTHTQRAFDPAKRRGHWSVLVSPDGMDDSLAIRQQAWLHGTQLGASESVKFPLQPARRYWLHLARGKLLANHAALQAGDSIGYHNESAELELTGADTEAVLADVLWFDLPE